MSPRSVPRYRADRSRVARYRTDLLQYLSLKTECFQMMVQPPPFRTPVPAPLCDSARPLSDRGFSAKFAPPASVVWTSLSLSCFTPLDFLPHHSSVPFFALPCPGARNPVRSTFRRPTARPAVFPALHHRLQTRAFRPRVQLGSAKPPAATSGRPIVLRSYRCVSSQDSSYF